ncbi:MAG TPA: ABC transporter permease [Vicinamibacterales bacterium]|nr:ABC transporter permease [Vicinamibacterales bacterium]
MTDKSPRWGRWWRPAVDDEVSDEFGFHMEMRVRDLVAEGLSPEEARAEARRRFGNLQDTSATCRALAHERDHHMHRPLRFEGIRQDVRFALRYLWRHPGFAATAVITLALGIGATTAIFSVVNAVLLRPLPFPEPQRLVDIHTNWRGNGSNVSAGNFTTGIERASVFDAVAAVQWSSLNLLDETTAERVLAARVSAGYFDVFPMTPLHGRVFTKADDVPGHDQVVVLSQRLWTRMFNADPTVIGRDVRLSGRPYQVIGVMPDTFDPTTEREEIWLPIAFTAERRMTHDEHFLSVFGRLKADVTAAQIDADLAKASARIVAADAQANQERVFAIRPLTELLVGNAPDRLRIWMAAVALVLLIACGNVANLLLARAASRQGELAVRAALGAGRTRIIRQLVTESLVLAAVATGLGLLIAAAGVRALVSLEPDTIARLDQASLDGTVFVFAVALAAACALVFGLWPAWSQSKSSVPSGIRQAGRGSESGRIGERWSTGLMVAELAVALVLLVGAGLMIRSVVALERADLGFRTDGLWTGRLSLPADTYADPARIVLAIEDLRQKVRAIPGVSSVAVTSQVPMGVGGNSNGLLPEGRTYDPSNAIDARLRIVSPGYLETLGASIVAGRSLSDADRRGGQKVMVINSRLAAAAFPGENAVGKRIACCEQAPDGHGPDFKTVVGVVADINWRGPGRPLSPEFYLPATQVPDEAWSWIQRTLYLVVRVPGDPLSLTEQIRLATRATVPGTPLFDVRTMDERRSRSQRAQTFNTTLLSILGLLGVVLASVGIYGVMAYFVNRRTREIGVRMALGATRSDVLVMVVRHAAVAVATGLAIGMALSFWATRLLTSQLFNTSPNDPLTLVLVSTLFALVALAATAVPALRAASVDPTNALRAD